MNNGYSGTGISIIFYLVLALIMPLIHFAHLSARHGLYMHRFVLRHFFYGIMIILTVLIVISWLIKVTGISTQSQWHVMLVFSAVSTIGLLVLWTVLPLIIKLFLKVFRIKPSLSVTPISLPEQFDVEHTQYRVIDSVMSPGQWANFRSKHYGLSGSRSMVKRRSALW